MFECDDRGIVVPVVPQKNLVSIVIVSYNTVELSISCLSSVFAETRLTPIEIIVWDNASSDSSVTEISARFSDRLRLISSPVNLGFAGANNQAIKYASGHRLLLLNPDTVVLDGAIDRLVSFANKYPQAKIWGGRTLAGDGRLDPSSCWGQQTLWSLICQASGLSVAFKNTNLFNPEGIGGWNRKGIRQVDIVSGCFFLIDRELWADLGGFNEDFFMYGEEADLCLRAKSHGASPIVTSDATIIHYGGASERVFADKLVKLLKSKRLLIDRHFPSFQRRLGKWLFYLWPVRRYFLHLILSSLGRQKSLGQRNAWKEALIRYREWC